MEDWYILQNPSAKRTAEEALAQVERIPRSVLIPGPDVFSDQTLPDLLNIKGHDLDERWVSKYGLRNGDQITFKSRSERGSDAEDPVVSVNQIPADQYLRVRKPYKFGFPRRRIKFFDQNYLLRKIIRKMPVGYGQRILLASEPGSGKSFTANEFGCDTARALNDDPTLELYYVSVGERQEDATDIEDKLALIDCDHSRVHIISLPEGAVVTSQWYMPWYYLEIAASKSLCGHNVFFIVDCVSRMWGAYMDPDIPKPKNDGAAKQGYPVSGLLKLRQLVLSKGGQVKSGSGSLTCVFVMLTGEGTAESMLYDQAGPAIETATCLLRDVDEIDIKRTRTRRTEYFFDEHDPFTQIYRRMELIRQAGWLEPVYGKTKPAVLTPNLEEEFRRHVEMCDAIFGKPHTEAMKILVEKAKEWHLLLELEG